jgi:ankyrin repeat protein
MGGFGTGVPLNAERKKREKEEAILKAKGEGKDLEKREKEDELMKEDGTPGKLFFDACKTGDIDLFKELYESINPSVFNINGTDFWKRSMLHVSSREGHPSLVNHLLKLGASTSVIDKDKDTPLHFACASGQTEIVRLLIAADANVNAKSGRGWTPLYDCITKDNRICAQQLISAGAEVNMIERYFQSTPLHLACKYNAGKLVTLLLSNGADVFAVDKEGNTAEDIATDNGHDDLAEDIEEYAEMLAETHVGLAIGKPMLEAIKEDTTY